MDTNTKILIAGHGDVMEKCLVALFRAGGFGHVLSSTEKRINLVDPLAARIFFVHELPEVVILTSVRSGGIGANQEFAGEFIYENLQAESNVIHLSFQQQVKKLLFVGASCVYPRDCPQPMKEEYFLTGAMEKTSEPYAMAKAAGIVMCQAYRKQYGFNATSIVPATVYGPGEGSASAENAHVMGANSTRRSRRGPGTWNCGARVTRDGSSFTRMISPRPVVLSWSMRGPENC